MNNKHSDSIYVHRLHRWVFATSTKRIAGIETVSLSTTLDATANTLTNAGLVVPNEIIYFSAVPAACGLSTATAYYVIAASTPDFFKVSLTLGGSAIDLLTSGAAVINEISVTFGSTDIGKRAYQEDTKTFWDIIDVVTGVPTWFRGGSAGNTIPKSISASITAFAVEAIFDPVISELTDGMIVNFTMADEIISVGEYTFTPNAGVITAFNIRTLYRDRYGYGSSKLFPGELGNTYPTLLQWSEENLNWLLLNPRMDLQAWMGNSILAATQLLDAEVADIWAIPVTTSPIDESYNPIKTITLDQISAKVLADTNKHITIYDQTGGVIVVDTDNNSLPIVNEVGATLFIDLVVSTQETVHTFVTYTASHTLALTDASTASNSSPIVEINVATANNLIVPPNSDVAFVVGSKIDVVSIGTGQTTLVAGTGVTIRTTPGLKFRAQNSGVTLIKRDINTWHAIGDLSA